MIENKLFKLIIDEAPELYDLTTKYFHLLGHYLISCYTFIEDLK